MDAEKHLEMMKRQINAHLGKGKADGILRGITAPPEDAPYEAVAQWAAALSARLESEIPEADLIPIREACACIKANKYSVYNKKYFPEIRAQHPTDDEAYLQAVAAFLNGRGRIGKRVSYADGRITASFGFGSSCVCTVIKGGWERPPSTIWCRCCQGTVKSLMQFVFPDRPCHIDIVETFATGGADCVFTASFGERVEN